MVPVDWRALARRVASADQPPPMRLRFLVVASCCAVVAAADAAASLCKPFELKPSSKGVTTHPTHQVSTPTLLTDCCCCARRHRLLQRLLVRLGGGRRLVGLGGVPAARAVSGHSTLSRVRITTCCAGTWPSGAYRLTRKLTTA